MSGKLNYAPPHRDGRMKPAFNFRYSRASL